MMRLDLVNFVCVCGLVGFAGAFLLSPCPSASPRKGNLLSQKSRCQGEVALHATGDGDFASTYDVQSPFLSTMKERGFIQRITDPDGLDELFLNETRRNGEPLRAYLGFDATADSLHVGSLMQIMILRHLQKCGHKPVVLLGGGTTKIGDPSGKDESRKLLDDATIQANMEGIGRVFKKFLKFGDGPTDAVFVNNADWLCELRYVDFLREFGASLSVNVMIKRESVKLRLEREQPLTFLEFNYMVMQGYDFVELHKRQGVRLQIGGSDQWGNILTGIEMAGRKTKDKLFGMTAPLMTTSDGKKMGKTAAGAVWLNEERLGPVDYWQFWRNTADADVVKFLKIFTEVPMEKIEGEISKLEGSELNAAKRLLADEATALLHGRDKLEGVHKAVDALFGASSGPSDLSALPSVQLKADALAEAPLTQLLVDLELCQSKSAARKLMEGGGIRLNDKQETDWKRTLTLEDFDSDGRARISSGRKKFAVVNLVKA
mmetsp:Transcript_20378/g.40822  ORF Transcript_20378/g.40822 Transcript_20378/m.40822 type:complete len:489 (-) Transcript_20378:128-1594(-)